MSEAVTKSDPDTQSAELAESDKPRPMPAADGLQEINIERAVFANRLLALFAPLVDSYAIQWGQKHLRGRNVFQGHGGLLLSPVSAHDNPLNLNPSNTCQAADILEKLEALIAVFEQQCNFAFEPDRIVSQWPDDVIWIELAQNNARALFGIPRQLQDAEALPLPAKHPVLRNMPMPVSPILRGPALDMAQAAHLGPGDLLLLPENPDTMIACDARYFGDATQYSGRYNLATGGFGAKSNAQQESSFMSQDETDTSNDQAGNEAATSSKDFKVPVSVCLPEQLVSAAALDNLSSGAIVDLMPLSEGLQVQLTVAGQALGTGEIVKLGDRFAVMMDHGADDLQDSASEMSVNDTVDAPEGNSGMPADINSEVGDAS